MSETKQKRTLKEYALGIIDEHNMLVCIIIVLLINAALYIVFLKYGETGVESHISCVVSMLSLFVTIWVAYWANSIRNRACNNFVKKILLDLMDDWKNEYKGIIEQLEEGEIDRAISTYEYSLANGKYLKSEVKTAIASAINMLKDAKDNKKSINPNQFKSQLSNIIDLTGELNQ